MFTKYLNQWKIFVIVAFVSKSSQMKWKGGHRLSLDEYAVVFNWGEFGTYQKNTSYLYNV